MNTTRPRPTPAPTLILFMLAAIPALAQPVAQEPASPAPAPAPGSPEQVEDALSILPRVGTNRTPVMPTRAAESLARQPGLTGGQDWLKVLHETLDEPIEPSTLAEGAFVLDRPGRLLEAPGGLLIFVPNRAARQPGEGPVLLMPCSTLGQLRTEWTGQAVRVSGEIYTYHERNQLLLSSYRIVSAQEPSPDPTTGEMRSGDDARDAPDASDAPDSRPPSIEDDPDVRDLLEELDPRLNPELDADADAGLDGSPRGQSRPHERLATLAGGAETGRRPQVSIPQSGTGPQEGALILRRPARMIRNSTGAWTIVFDNDDPGSPDATALIVEPCRMLMRIEKLAMESGDGVRFLVSGRVYTYLGDHYILPTMMQRIRARGLGTLQ